MKRIRVLLGDMPRLVHDIVRDAMIRQPDLEIVGEIDNMNDLGATLCDVAPDVVILGQPSGNRGGGKDFLPWDVPSVAFLLVSADGREAYSGEWRCRRVAVDLSRQDLVDAIRAACAATSK